MNMSGEFASTIAQIEAKLDSVGHLKSRRGVGKGISLVFSTDLLAGWFGIRDDQGSWAFGPASDILKHVQNYVDRVQCEQRSSLFDAESFWPLMAGLLPQPPSQ